MVHRKYAEFVTSAVIMILRVLRSHRFSGGGPIQLQYRARAMVSNLHLVHELLQKFVTGRRLWRKKPRVLPNMREHVVKIVAACDHFQNRHIAPWAPAQLGTRNGTGVVVQLQNSLYVLTCAHVVHGATDGGIKVREPAAQSPLKAQLVALMPDTDLALLKVPDLSAKPMAFGDDRQLQRRQNLFCGGFPLSYDDYQETQAEFTIRNRNQDGKLQLAGNCNPGDSGGPVAILNAGAYHMIGQIQSKATGAGVSGIVYATPISHIRPLLQHAVQAQTSVLRRPALGFRVHDNTPEANAFRGVNGAGVVVFGSRRADLEDGSLLLAVKDPATNTECTIDYDGRVRVKYCEDGVSLLDLFNQTPLHRAVSFLMFKQDKTTWVDLPRIPSLELGNRLLEMPHEVQDLPFETVGLTVTSLHRNHVDTFEIEHLDQQTLSKPHVVVTQVHASSLFARCAVRSGDIVLSVNDQQIGTVAQYQKAFAKPKRGKDGELYVKLRTCCGHDCVKCSIAPLQGLLDETSRFEQLGIPVTPLSAVLASIAKSSNQKLATSAKAVKPATLRPAAPEVVSIDDCDVPELENTLPPILQNLHK